MDVEQNPRSFEQLSDQSLEAMDEVLDKKGSMKNADDFKRISVEAGIPELIPQWNAAFRRLGASTSEAQYKYASTIQSKMNELAKLRKSLVTEGGRRRRKYTRRYCKKTPCRRMGFTQKASCRPYKNCYKPTRS